jgi:hypothetical protein
VAVDLTKVSKGDPITIPASTWNAFVDAAVAHRQSSPGARGVKGAKQLHPDHCLVQNISGELLERHRAVAIRAAVIEPTDDADEFARRIVLTCDVPATDDKGRWGVLATNLLPGPSGDEPNGQIGVVVIAGITQCRINLINIDDTHVEVTDGQAIPASGNPDDGTPGLAQIIWVAGGVGTATAAGVQDAVIRLGTRLELPRGEFQYMLLGQGSQDGPLTMDFARLHPMP